MKRSWNVILLMSAILTASLFAMMCYFRPTLEYDRGSGGVGVVSGTIPEILLDVLLLVLLSGVVLGVIGLWKLFRSFIRLIGGTRRPPGS